MVAVDGASTQGLSLEAVQSMLLGPEGSTCLVSLYRGEEGLYFEVPLLRHSARPELLHETPPLPPPPHAQTSRGVTSPAPDRARDDDASRGRSAQLEEVEEASRREFVVLKCNARYVSATMMLTRSSSRISRRFAK